MCTKDDKLDKSRNVKKKIGNVLTVKNCTLFSFLYYTNYIIIY